MNTQSTDHHGAVARRLTAIQRELAGADNLTPNRRFELALELVEVAVELSFEGTDPASFEAVRVWYHGSALRLGGHVSRIAAPRRAAAIRAEHEAAGGSKRATAQKLGVAPSVVYDAFRSEPRKRDTARGGRP